MPEEKVHEPEVVKDNQALPVPAVPGVPVPSTLTELSVRKAEAMEIIEARSKILERVRSAAIKTTSPEDWLFFRDPDGREVGYLQDCGGERLRDLFGIEVFDVSAPEKVKNEADGSFMYVIRGSGRSRLTGQVLEAVEGGRASTDDFVSAQRDKPLSPAQLELNVRKAARANLDGNITRELSGLKSVPIGEVAKAWQGTGKDVGRCRKGRGYKNRDGSDAAVGASVGSASPGTVDYSQDLPPFCGNCQAVMKLFPPGKSRKPPYKPYAAFWGCPKKCPNTGIKAEDHHKNIAMSKAAEAKAKLDAEAKEAAAMGREPGDGSEEEPGNLDFGGG